MKKEKTWVKKVLLLGIILAAVLVYILVPPVNSSINRVMKMFASGDFDVVREFVASYGAYAALASFLLMIFQSVAAPLPAFLLTLANANLFGWWQGAILSWSSAMAGAAVCFFIARILGRDAAERLTSKAGIAQIDTFFEKYGRNTILICRLLPFISFDIVSYAAGLTSMSFGSFFLATGIGQLPATIVYLCGRYADRRGAAFDDGIADPVRFIGAGRNVKKNIYGQAKYQKRRRKIMETYYNPEDLGKFGTIGEEAPVLAEKFFDYYGAVFAEGALTQREKSLIALAVAHAVQCPYCIDSYTNDCLNKGVSEEEMTEAVHVAAAIRGGATLVHGVQMKNVIKKLEL